MLDLEDIDGLEGLYRDLVCLKERRLVPVGRLLSQIQSRVDQFRQLIDTQPKNEKSREAILSGTITIDGTQYEINSHFQNEAIQLADELQLDELEAARYFLLGQEDSVRLDRSPKQAAIIRFHWNRQFLLDCLRILLERPSGDYFLNDSDRLDSKDEGALDGQQQESLIEYLDVLKNRIVTGDSGRPNEGSVFWRRCFDSMESIQKWLMRFSDQLQKLTVIGHTLTPELNELYDHQRTSLTLQHETLAAICCYLIRDSYASVSDFLHLIDRLKFMDKLDLILIHHMPILIALTHHFCQKEQALSPDELSKLKQALYSTLDSSPWAIHRFHSCAVVLWLSEYSGLDFGPNNDKERMECSQQLIQALKDGAFHFLLSVCKESLRHDRHHSAKDRLVAYLLQEAQSEYSETELPSPNMQVIISKYLQIFIDSLISNLPDTLRLLKDEEDENHRLQQSTYMRGQSEYHLHPERFMLIVSYAYEGSPATAIDFWISPETMLNGFLHWAATRLTVPRAAAFCEMLTSISEGPICADHAHQFLLEHSTPLYSQNRRTTTISWSQIFGELRFHSSLLKDRSAGPSSHHLYSSQGLSEQSIEPESLLMLESYLRLIAHMCRNSHEARRWVTSQNYFNITEVSLELCATGVESTIRACAFDVIASLLTEKSLKMSRMIWTTLDQWLFSGASNRSQSSLGLQESANQEMMILETVASTFEEANAFVVLLNALFAYPNTSFHLNDVLPFPENLGTLYRMPGVDSYIDYAVGRLFGGLSQDLDRNFQLRLICLNLIHIFLSSFNENLLLISMLSNVKVDTAVDCSTLSTYVLLHPFSRVMDWMFNSRVLATLFATAHQEIDVVNKAPPESALMLSLIRSIQVMLLVSKLQTTYFDYVRPLNKANSTKNRPAVTDPSLTSFESAISNNLQLVVDLALYCGTPNEELAKESLKLLEKISSSRRLSIASSIVTTGVRAESSKIISIVERNNDTERISRAIIAQMGFDPRELECGPKSPAYQIKSHILYFLHKCLNSQLDQPTLAHLLLGFSCLGNSVGVQPDGLFDLGISLFHSILHLAVEYALHDGKSLSSWTEQIKLKCTNILKILWKSPLTTSYVMAELRANDYAFHLMLRHVLIDSNTLWDGRHINDEDFLLSSSAEALSSFLQQRSAFYDHFARELRATELIGLPGLQGRLQSALLGLTLKPDGDTLFNPNIFDLFDFLELELPASIRPPPLFFFQDLDLSICEKEPARIGGAIDLERMEQLLALRMKEMQKTGKIDGKTDGPECQQELVSLMNHARASSNLASILEAKYEALKSWLQLVTVFLESNYLQPELRRTIIFQWLKFILPKLKRALSSDVEAATQLFRAARTVLRQLDPQTYNQTSQNGDISKGFLFQTFKTSLDGIISLTATAELREACEQVCFIYLLNYCKCPVKPTGLSQSVLRVLKPNSDRLIEIFCDDAQDGSITSRMSALILLEMLVHISSAEGATFVIEALSSLNFTGLLVDSIKNIPRVTDGGESEGLNHLLACYNAVFSLLLKLAQTRLGAEHLLNAGLFQAVSDSQLFSVDPDMEMKISNPNGSTRSYNLILSLLKMINSAVLSRGIHHERTRAIARDFLIQSRFCILGIFKKYASLCSATGAPTVASTEFSVFSGPESPRAATLDPATEAEKDTLKELVDNFTILIAITDFLEMEESAALSLRPVAFNFSNPNPANTSQSKNFTESWSPHNASSFAVGGFT